MQIKLLKVISKIFFVGLIIAVPSSSLCEAVEDFPFHVGKAAEKGMTFDYSFDDVWEASLAVLKDIDNAATAEMKAKNMKSFKSNIKDDKNSGLITYTTTHKEKKVLLTAKVLPSFTYKVFLIEAIEKQKTRIYFHKINYISYKGVLFGDNVFVPHLYFALSEGNFLEEIRSRLKLRTHENN